MTGLWRSCHHNADRLPPTDRRIAFGMLLWIGGFVWGVQIILGTVAGCALAADAWERIDRDLLKNFNNMYNPCVVQVEGEFPFRMWFFGWATETCNPGFPGCDAIYHARSKDLLTWQVWGEDGWDTSMDPHRWTPVLHASDRWYDAWHVGDPSVVQRDGQFVMAYSATSKDFGVVAGYPARIVQCVMGAVSDDGVHWRKTDEPLLIRPEDQFPPVPDAKRIGDYHRPCLRWEDGRWRLWFDYAIPGKGCCMGYAENTGEFGTPGGFVVQHALSEPLLENWPNPEVVRIGDRYFGFSDPGGYPIQADQSRWMSRQIREAVSEDGIHWKRLDYISPDDDADACHVPQTFLYSTEGKQWLYLFYATQIGYRRDDGQYHYQYDRIRVMRREIH
jgi:hypothetical protein